MRDKLVDQDEAWCQSNSIDLEGRGETSETWDVGDYQIRIRETISQVVNPYDTLSEGCWQTVMVVMLMDI